MAAISRRRFGALTISASALAATKASALTKAELSGNPLLKPWTLPFEAIPFDEIKTEHFKPAFEKGMELHRREIAAIANSKSKPTFKNTLEALEKSGAVLGRVSSVFYYLGGSYTNDAIQDLERTLAPALSKHGSDISLNPALFARIDAVFQNQAQAKLSAEQTRVLLRYHTDFVRAGAKLSPEAKVRKATIDQRLATLYTQFAQNQLAEENAWTLALTTESDLAGLPEGLRAAALEAGSRRNQEGVHLITLSRSLVAPFLTYSARRDLRERAQKAWAARGNNNNANDNKAIISEILTLRQEMAELLGFKTFAHYATADVMAGSPEAALELLGKVWTPALAAMDRDRKELEALAKADGLAGPLEAWDWRYYAEKVRRAKYDLDEAETKPYFELGRIGLGKFYLAEQLFGVTFREMPQLPVYAAEVRSYEVLDRKGQHMALYYVDDFARPQKRSGAWQSTLRAQQTLNGEKAVASNNNNFAKGPGGITLLSYDDAQTMFHEFGHAMHAMMSNVTYPYLSGTSVDRDFVEFPSQVFERWFSTNEILTRYAFHYQTGERIPDSLIQRINAAKNFDQGFATVEYIASALVDLEMHLNPAAAKDPVGFEAMILAKYKMPRDIVMRHRTTQFGHIFAGEGYAAGYYTYLWSDQMGADGFNAFLEAGNIFDPAVAKRFETYVYAAGNTRPAAEAYKGFRGRLPTVDPLLKARGFI